MIALQVSHPGLDLDIVYGVALPQIDVLITLDRDQHALSTASAEQHVGVRQLTEVLSRIDQFTQHNAALVEQARGASEALYAQSGRLVSVVARFRIEEETGDGGRRLLQASTVAA